MSEILLRKLFYNPETGLQGVESLYRKSKELDPTITRKEVTAWLKKQETSQVHAPVRKIKHFFPIKSNYLDHIWQVDLMDVSSQAHNNSGINFFLCAIDIWSRFVWVRLLKNKTNVTCTEAFSSILKESGRKPKVLMSDLGSEWISRNFKSLMKTNDIEQSFAEVGDHHRMGIVERFNKTIRNLLTRFMTAYKTKRYVDAIPKLVINYNNTKHSSTGSTPSKPDDEKIRAIIKKKESKAKEDETEFNIGDSVRSLKNRVMFEKGAIAKYSSTVHKIVNFIGTKRYELDNGKSYLYYQLRPANDTETFEPPEASEPKSPKRLPKKNRLALKKEGVEPLNVREGLRERKPAVGLVSSKGERLLWS